MKNPVFTGAGVALITPMYEDGSINFDELGRIVLPIELRRTLGIEEKDRIEIFVDGESIILRKYQPACIFCDNAKDIINYKGKNICPDCIRAMNEKL